MPDQQVAQLIGGAGTGKTTELLRIMEQLVDRLHDPHLIGFVSFTRAARAEAAARAADKFGMKVSDLENHGWFRTLHSVCYKCLGVSGGELLTDNAESREWLKAALDEEVKIQESDDGADVFQGKSSVAEKALALWGAARNRLEPYADAWARVAACDERCPQLGACVDVVERYEQAKRLDDRMDFTDMLAWFAGWKITVDGAERCRPRGETPDLPVWFFDEQQDASALLDSVCKRLISNEYCRWVYVVGDPFQAIYGWAGADSRHFLDWPAAKRRVMPKSYRCPPEILAKGEEILSACTDYWDRGIAPADREGSVEVAQLSAELVEGISPAESWLMIARTNFHARRLAALLDEQNIPWMPTHGACQWTAPVRAQAIKALLSIEQGAPIDGGQWQQVLKYLPSKAPGSGMALVEHGAKTRFKAIDPKEAQERWLRVFPSELSELGATPELVEAIRRGEWTDWVDGAESYVKALGKWGDEVVDKPEVRVGTIHSVKGQEADNVMVFTSISRPCVLAAQSEEGRNEEQRVKYVAVTRARRRLVIVNEARTQYRWRI